MIPIVGQHRVVEMLGLVHRVDDDPAGPRHARHQRRPECNLFGYRWPAIVVTIEHDIGTAVERGVRRCHQFPADHRVRHLRSLERQADHRESLVEIGADRRRRRAERTVGDKAAPGNVHTEDGAPDADIGARAGPDGRVCFLGCGGRLHALRGGRGRGRTAQSGGGDGKADKAGGDRWSGHDMYLANKGESESLALRIRLPIIECRDAWRRSRTGV
ncbi:hypothetical protein SPHINGOT1_260235 [Sphingomonas sp. T1]|nr:hypothetical protein SPHINGOT1_260235 [Sphingomonas sp. T1]